MSLFREVHLSWLQTLVLNIIKNGPKIRHVAFIMDGNRRYAKAKNIKIEEGHSKGFDKISDILKWCQLAGINEVTVYAFSIDNFNRNADQVEKIMSLALKVFHQLLKEIEKHKERGLCVHVIGNLDLIPYDLRQLMYKVMKLTKDNKSIVLNIAFAYTSRYDITSAISNVCKEVANDPTTWNSVNEELVSNHLQTSSFQSDPDLLIRTSGEFRLSDFLLWQISSTILLFNDQLWPEYNFWAFIGALFYFQHHSKSFLNVKNGLLGKKKKPV